MNNQLIFTGYTLTDANLYGGVNYAHDINNGNDLNLGVAAAASVSFVIDNTANDADKYMGKSFTWKCKMFSESTFKTMGIFNVYSVVKNKSTATITAYDNMSKFDIYIDAWLAGLTFPMTLLAFTQSLCNYCGVTLNTTNFTNYNFSLSDNFTSSNITGRQIVQYIAQASATFAYIGINGQLYFKYYTASATTLNNTKYAAVTIAEYQTALINKLQIQTTADDVGVIVGTGTNTYVMQDNPLFYCTSNSEISTQAAAIYAVINTLQYTPMTITLFEDFNIKCGDIITVNGITTVVMSKSITQKGVTLSSVGNKIRSTQVDSVNSSINQLRGKTNELTRTVEETLSKLSDAEGNITTISQKVDGITMTYSSRTGSASITIGNITLNTGDSNFIQDEAAAAANNAVAGINLNGYVTFSSLSNSSEVTLINGAQICTAKIYAGSTSTGYAEMLNTGLNVYDPNGNKKIAMGWTDGQFTSPYITLGIGTNETGNTAGLVKKFADGIWIGDATAKGDSSPSGTGFFIDITNDTFYKYVNGTATPFSACVFT